MVFPLFVTFILIIIIECGFFSHYKTIAIIFCGCFFFYSTIKHYMHTHIYLKGHYSIMVPSDEIPASPVIHCMKNSFQLACTMLRFFFFIPYKELLFYPFLAIKWSFLFVQSKCSKWISDLEKLVKAYEIEARLPLFQRCKIFATIIVKLLANASTRMQDSYWNLFKPDLLSQKFQQLVITLTCLFPYLFY